MNISVLAAGICAAIISNSKPKDLDVIDCEFFVSGCEAINYKRYFDDNKLARHCADMASEKFYVGYEWCQ